MASAPLSTLRTLEELIQLAAPLAGSPIGELDPLPSPPLKVKRGYLIRIKNMDFDRIHISSRKIDLIPTIGWTVKDTIDAIDDIVDPDNWQAETPRPRGHKRKRSATRFDMNLTKRSNPTPAILVFHFDKSGYSFMTAAGTKPAKYDPAPFALTSKNYSGPPVMYVPQFADDTGNTIVTICETIPPDTTGKSPPFEYNIAARITDSHQSNYVTPIIIDPKVKNDG